MLKTLLLQFLDLQSGGLPGPRMTSVPEEATDMLSTQSRRVFSGRRSILGCTYNNPETTSRAKPAQILYDGRYLVGYTPLSHTSARAMSNRDS